MKIIKFWFWNAKKARQDGKPLTLVDRVIMLRSNLTHVEIQFVDRDGVSFSATVADGADGCRFKYIGYSHPERWECLTFNIPDSVEAYMWERACICADLSVGWQIRAERIFINGKRPQIYKGKNNVKYDATGLLSFALRKSNKWWLDAIRGTVWCWTKLRAFVPDDVKVWCSEVCCRVWNFGWSPAIPINERMVNIINPVEISPQELFEKLKGR